MVDQRLINYIKANLNNGMNIELIKNNLINAGWQEKVIDEAILASNPEIAQNYIKKIAKKRQNQKLTTIWIAMTILFIILIIASIFYFIRYTNKHDSAKHNSINTLKQELNIELEN